jgi:hypothetical protein
MGSLAGECFTPAMSPATPRPLTVMAVAGLVVAAAAAGATAATQITSQQIKDETIQSRDVKNGQLTGADVKDGSLASADLKNGGVARADLAPAVAGSLAGGRIPSGTTVTGYAVFEAMAADPGQFSFSVDLPGAGGTPLYDTNVDFAPDSTSRTVDDDGTTSDGDPACPDWPEPPAAGQVCLYVNDPSPDTSDLQGLGIGLDRSFVISWYDAAEGNTVRVKALWAYTAP